MCQLSNTFPADDSATTLPQVMVDGRSSASSSSSDDNHSMSFSLRRHRTTSIMKTSTLDESINSSTTSSCSTRRRSSSSSFRMPVSFDIVEIHEHPIILDESRNGPALTIDWKPIHTEVMTVQEFDCCSNNNKKTSNTNSQHRHVRTLDVGHRVAILIKAGYSKEDLCNHFASNVESSSPSSPSSLVATEAVHPKRQPQQPQTQTQTQTQTQQKPQTKTMLYQKVKKVAQKFRKQAIHNTTIRID